MSFRSIWRSLTRNLGWKLGSLVLSVSLWFAIVGQPELVSTHTAPILYKNLSSDLLIGSSAIDSVRLELRGTESKLAPANLGDVAVTVDLSMINGPGERTFTLADNDFHLPQGVTFVRAIPSQLRLQFSRMMKKDVPVNARVSRPPPNGYRITAQTVTPNQLRIVGPETRVAKIESAQTDPIDLSSVTQSSEFHVNCFVPDSQVRFEASSVVTVKVTVERIGP